jgi:hypothetical protein
VTLTDRNRLGLLGKGAVLMRPPTPDRTSPVLRGAWVLDKIIGSAADATASRAWKANLSQARG